MGEAEIGAEVVAHTVLRVPNAAVGAVVADIPEGDRLATVGWEFVGLVGEPAPGRIARGCPDAAGVREALVVERSGDTVVEMVAGRPARVASVAGVEQRDPVVGEVGSAASPPGNSFLRRVVIADNPAALAKTAAEIVWAQPAEVVGLIVGIQAVLADTTEVGWVAPFVVCGVNRVVASVGCSGRIGAQSRSWRAGDRGVFHIVSSFHAALVGENVDSDDSVSYGARSTC